MGENTNKIQWPGWETIGMIGRGSFGAVYEIERKVFDDVEKAALKVITIPQNEGDIEEMYSDGYDEESITSTFQSHLKSIVAEYSLMRKMNGCVNIVNCDDIHYEQHEDGIGWDIFIKMELLTPLIKALPETITDEHVIKIAKDMCAALDVCKSYGIIHRDIKPQNIFVSAYGDYKLGDFGIAKTVEKTMSGTVIGTYKYMAPEVYNNQPYGTSADIYSLGLVLYWLLNERRMPFMPLPPEKLKHGMEEESRNRRFSGEPLPPPAHGSERLKKIVLKACAYNPADRYSSAAEMLQDLNGNDNSVVIPPVVNAVVEEKPEEVLYTIRFRDEDGTLLSSENYKEGEKIKIPTIIERQIDGKTYGFREWSPAIQDTANGSVEYRAVYKEKAEVPVILPATDKNVTSISQPRKTSNKKWIVAVLALLVVGIFAFIWLSNAASVRIGNYEFKGEQRKILCQWAKSIDISEYLNPNVNKFQPKIIFKDEGKSFSITPTTKDFTKVHYFIDNRVAIGSSSDLSLARKAANIVDFHDFTYALGGYRDYKFPIWVGYNGNNQQLLLNKEDRKVAHEIALSIFSKNQPVSYDIPQVIKDIDYADISFEFVHNQNTLFYSFRIYYKDNTVLPTVILFSENSPILEFELNEKEIAILYQINELIEHYSA